MNSPYSGYIDNCYHRKLYHISKQRRRRLDSRSEEEEKKLYKSQKVEAINFSHLLLAIHS